tara:strand:+ start:206 stop:418 length:213 start_codon:yes stop_codon:yes gene_type:complete
MALDTKTVHSRKAGSLQRIAQAFTTRSGDVGLGLIIKSTCILLRISKTGLLSQIFSLKVKGLKEFTTDPK